MTLECETPRAARDVLRSGILNVGVKFGCGYASNGARWTWMVDSREILLTRPYLKLAGELLWARLKAYRPTHVGGMTLAANPLTAAVLYEAWAENYPLDGFLIRKTPKENGLRKLVEGPPLGPDARLVLVDDMVNSGTTQRAAFRALGSTSRQILAVGTVLDAERIGRAWLLGQGVEVEALFTLKELGLAMGTPLQSHAARLAWRWKVLNGGSHSAPHSTPAITADRIVAGSDKGFVVCLDHAGNEIWRFDARLSRNGIHSSPIIRGDRVWVGSYDGFVYCLDLTNGRCLWERRVGQWVGSSPALDVVGHTLFVGTEFGEAGGSLVALSAASGDLRWETRLGHYVHSAPCFDAFSNAVIVGCNDGNLYAIDATTGSVRWQFSTSREIKSGPTIDENRVVYCCSLDGNLYAVDADTGSLHWSRRLGRSAYFRPLLSGSVVIAAGSSGRLVALARASGEILWIAAMGSGIQGGATLTSNGDIVVGSQDGAIYLFESATGELRWTFRTGGPVTAEPGIYGDLIAVPSRDGYLYAFRVSKDVL